jgi:hypothetical protein
MAGSWGTVLRCLAKHRRPAPTPVAEHSRSREAGAKRLESDHVTPQDYSEFQAVQEPGANARRLMSGQTHEPERVSVRFSIEPSLSNFTK